MLKDVGLGELPLYSFKEVVANGMRLHNVLLPRKMPKRDSIYRYKALENKCGEFSVYDTLANSVIRRGIDNTYVDTVLIYEICKTTSH